jgi:hypothetical protein
VTDVEIKERKAEKELTVSFILSFAAILSKILSYNNERNVRNQHKHSIAKQALFMYTYRMNFAIKDKRL